MIRISEGKVRTRKAILLLAVGVILLAQVVTAPAYAYPRPGITERVSLAWDGSQALRSLSGHFLGVASVAISADGRYVAFRSTSSNLVPGDTNKAADVFVRDRNRTTARTERISLPSHAIQEANGPSGQPAISADGRYVAFQSGASNLVPGDTNNTNDVFLHDRKDGTTERVSVAHDGTEIESSGPPSISANGRYIVFSSDASNVVPGDTNGGSDVFVHDRESGSTKRVSVTGNDIEGNGGSWAGVGPISADGRYIFFYSDASNLVPGDTNKTADVFVRDRVTATTERVSLASAGSEANSPRFELNGISADGRYVAFSSDASNLVPGDTNGYTEPGYDMFVHDRQTGITERVSVTSAGGETSGRSFVDDGAISPDGRYVIFESGEGADVLYLHDRESGSTERISVATDGTPGWGWFESTPAFSASGHVVFSSDASNLVSDDTNSIPDIFLRERPRPHGALSDFSVLKAPGGGVGAIGKATFSGIGVAQASDAGDDGEGLGPASARALGAELIGGRVVYRPEEEDFFVRLDLSSLPPVAAGLPGILYGLQFKLDATRFEVRILRATATSVRPGPPYVALYRCAPDCIEETALTGALGSIGTTVTVSVPTSAVGAKEHAELSELRAYTALGEAALGGRQPFDEMAIPNATIPVSRVNLGIARASTPAKDVAFTVTADLFKGDFSGTVPTKSLPAGTYRVWARACLGDDCGVATSREIAL